MADLHESAYAVCQEAMAMLRQEQTLDETSVLTGYKDAAKTKRADKVERACNRGYETARHEVMDSFGWSFCKNEIMATSTYMSESFRYRTVFPGDALKILECKDELGRSIPFTVYRNEFVFTLDKPSRIAYIYDEPNIDYWNALARRALVCCLAKNLCVEITGRPDDCKLLTNIYDDAFEKAKTEDSAHTRNRGAYRGGNYIYECMTGRRRPTDGRSL